VLVFQAMNLTPPSPTLLVRELLPKILGFEVWSFLEIMEFDVASIPVRSIMFHRYDDDLRISMM
jgi:hypothetical protein